MIRLNEIKKYRERVGLSQHRLGKKIGVTRQTVMKIENEKVSPTLEVVLKISEVLGEKPCKIFNIGCCCNSNKL